MIKKNFAPHSISVDVRDSFSLWFDCIGYVIPNFFTEQFTVMFL